MQHINRLYLLASRLLSYAKVESTSDWMLELALERKRAEQNVQRIGLGAFSAGLILGGCIALAVVVFYFAVR